MDGGGDCLSHLPNLHAQHGKDAEIFVGLSAARDGEKVVKHQTPSKQGNASRDRPFRGSNTKRNHQPMKEEIMKHVTAFVHFDGNCRQAMLFYQQCLGAELQLNPYPDAEGKPSLDSNAKIMHSQLSHGGAPLLMASDGAPGASYQPGKNFSVSIECDSLDEIERLFAAFSQNGQVTLPLGDMPWGARFGMLTDQFDIQWFFNCTLTQ